MGDLGVAAVTAGFPLMTIAIVLSYFLMDPALRVLPQGASMLVMARVAGMNGFLLSGPLTDVIVSHVSLPMLWLGLSRLNLKNSMPAEGNPDGGQDDLLRDCEPEGEARSVREA